ncbi:ParB/RepB/Spo0J family partition protein [Oxalobacteraceae bacterium GrIS 1.11]
MPTTEIAVADLGHFEQVRRSTIRISKTNRTRFDQIALQNLAANIKEVGIVQPILLRQVVPTAAEPEIYEIVAGERRYRAACIADLEFMPAMVRALTDKQAMEIQLIENIQREDPHPLEEAFGYQQLMLNFGYNADDLAEKVQKSRSYIYGRLKLCALANGVREQFLDNKISPAIALLIARLSMPAMQVKATQEILKPHHYNEPMSFRQAREHLRTRYMLDLKDAVFSIKDASLIADAGSCTDCPKRSGNQPEIFEDEKSGDICTDPDCYAEKRAAHANKVKLAAVANGLTVITGGDAKKLMPNSYDGIKGGYSNLDHEFYFGSTGKTTYRKLLGTNTPDGSLLENPHAPGTFINIASTFQLEFLIEQAGGKVPETAATLTAKERAREREQEEKAKIEREYRRRLFSAIRDAGEPEGSP